MLVYVVYSRYIDLGDYDQDDTVEIGVLAAFSDVKVAAQYAELSENFSIAAIEIDAVPAHLQALLEKHLQQQVAKAAQAEEKRARQEERDRLAAGMQGLSFYTFYFVEGALYLDGKVGPEVCTIPRLQQAHRLSKTSELLGNLPVAAQSHYLISTQGGIQRSARQMAYLNRTTQVPVLLFTGWFRSDEEAEAVAQEALKEQMQ